MISLTLFRANFDELNIHYLSKRVLLDSLRVFYNGSDYEYLEFLESLGIDYYKKFNNLFELNKEINNEIRIFNALAQKQELDKFDFKAINLLRRNLKEINDSEYLKLNLDLREINDNNQLSLIKDAFILTHSTSLVDFKEIEEQRISLIYHKRGAILYDNNFVLSNSRDSIQLLESFKEAKDNNFIVARFLLELSKKLKEANINESFCYSYKVGDSKKEVIKDIDEIIHWGDLSKEEKELEKERLKQEESLSTKAVEIAKSELKEERDNLRASLRKESSNAMLENEKTLPRLNNINAFYQTKHNAQSQNLNTSGDSTYTQSSQTESPLNTQEQIQKIISDGFELYCQKEIEKANIRLQKAKKDSFNAYEDLKESLNNGYSILEAIKTIQQKYRNEDTINFASLLFSQDILNIKARDEEIKSLKIELSSAQDSIEELNEQITKREETISKQKGTIQTKVNEITALKYEFEEEIESLRQTELKFKELENLSNEQEATINALDKENAELSQENKELNEEKIKLQSENHYLQDNLKESKERENLYKIELEKFKAIEKDKLRVELELESLKVKETNYKEQIEELREQNKENFKKDLMLEKLQNDNIHLQNSLKDSTQKELEYKEKITSLEARLDGILNQFLNKENEQEPKKNLRSRDILGG
ncbi:hypothetical protein [Helicobacter turcicus]|uniref:Uncharacterized protein n=1 Tax=Helicobacter turcicus TaxID=2867412 RepID=A0ABS7JPF0_9HELI|nr:hypothetical protein [Helicobacter turcicus]MBX7491281.1 hypothetical protein [Helicobacter turcicus]MBX7546080.1 hypothetical protein [Helicobacter turcicus]